MLSDIGDYVLTGVKSGSAEWGSVGAAFGTKTVTLTTAQMPSHSHGGGTGAAGNHNHAIYVSGTQLQYINTSASLSSGMGGLAGVFNNDNLRTGYSGDHSHGISAEGGGGSFSVTQPSRAALLVIKT